MASGLLGLSMGRSGAAMQREEVACVVTLFQSAAITKTARRMLCASGVAQRQQCALCCVCWSMCELSVLHVGRFKEGTEDTLF